MDDLPDLGTDDDWTDEEDVAADADLDVMPGAPKMTEDSAKAFLNLFIQMAMRNHKDGAIITDAVKRAEAAVRIAYPDANPLSKASITAITKLVIMNSTRGKK